ncbi:hypothetical protein SPBR_03473 [Sporothrix brasiliensis 5110]|uniref:Uncharacterized protein n=1 Tax=Sporothrix brasiliensis 5110 TaxID=1398154 RepID=A0A0C2J815_9PEZI|nr:uncharacterized protein SPBR_03473 [Sporothrix brasiliensis 5110]KIH95130.1 hypothetical protein SPBR_03473 [Sporothrix brasiliensis 5110]
MPALEHHNGQFVVSDVSCCSVLKMGANAVEAVEAAEAFASIKTSTSTTGTGTIAKTTGASRIAADRIPTTGTDNSSRAATATSAGITTITADTPTSGTGVDAAKVQVEDPAPPPKKYARIPPPIEIGGKLRNSTAFLLSPSPPQSALLSPPSGTLFSTPSTSSLQSPFSSLFNNTVSAPDTRASSPSSRTLTKTAIGSHTDDDGTNNSSNSSSRTNNDDTASTCVHGASESVSNPTSPTLTVWPGYNGIGGHDTDSDNLASQLIGPVRCRSLSAGHSSMTMTATAATRNATASDNCDHNHGHFLRASFDGTAAGRMNTARTSTSSHGNGNSKSNSSNSRWRPTSAKSARSAERVRRRSPSPLFNPFARVSRHRHNDTRDNNNNDSMLASTSNGRQPTYNRRGSLSSGAAPPPLTREEFEALPVAIQRKIDPT